MSSRPKLQIAPTTTDKVITTITWLLLIILWGFTIYAYVVLPDTVPTHFNANGEVDNTGSKGSIWVLPLITTFTVILLQIITKYPHHFNYPFQITEENAEFQYRNAIKLIRVISLTMVITFLAITLMIYAVTQGWVSNAGFAFIAVLTMLPLIPVIYFIMRMKRGK